MRQRVYETLNAFRKASHQQRKKRLLIDCPYVPSFYQKCTILSSLAWPAFRTLRTEYDEDAPVRTPHTRTYLNPHLS